MDSDVSIYYYIGFGVLQCIFSFCYNLLHACDFLPKTITLFSSMSMLLFNIKCDGKRSRHICIYIEIVCLHLPGIRNALDITND